MAKRAYPTRDPRPGYEWVECTMCSGEGEILSRWSAGADSRKIRCPRCFRLGWVQRSLGLLRKDHPPTCSCAACNRKRWDDVQKVVDKHPTGCDCPNCRKSDPRTTTEESKKSETGVGQEGSHPEPEPSSERVEHPPSRKLDEERRVRERNYEQGRPPIDSRPPKSQKSPTPASRPSYRPPPPPVWPPRYNRPQRPGRGGRNVSFPQFFFWIPLAVILTIVGCISLAVWAENQESSEPRPTSNRSSRVSPTPTRTYPIATASATPELNPTHAFRVETGTPRSTPVPTPLPTRIPASTPTPLPTAAPAPPTPTPTLIPAPTPIPTTAPDPTSTAAPFPGGTPLDAAEINSLVIQLTNQERVALGLLPLSEDGAINAIALAHSTSMAESGILSHTIGGQDPTERALAAGYDCKAYRDARSYTYGLSENIANYPRVRTWTRTILGGKVISVEPTSYRKTSEDMARALVTGWMNSPGHRKNILDPYAVRIGVGIYIQRSIEHEYVSETVWATQNFSECK